MNKIELHLRSSNAEQTLGAALKRLCDDGEIRVPQLDPDKFAIRGADTYVNTSDGWTKFAHGLIIPILHAYSFDQNKHAYEVLCSDSCGGIARITVTGDEVVNPKIIEKRLATQGTYLMPGMLPLFRYLFRPERLEDEAQLVGRMGWSVHGEMRYQFGAEQLIPEGSELTGALLLNTAVPAGIASSGTLDLWRDNVANQCYGPYQTFACFAGASVVLGDLLSEPSVMIHFHGPSTAGKTTLMQIAISSMGCAADPASGNESTLIGTWSGSSNAIESQVARSSGFPVGYDELGMYKGRDLSNKVYSLVGSTSKSRCNADGEVKNSARYTTLAVSTGEISVKQAALKHGDYPDGASIRCLDIPVKVSAGETGEQPEELRERIRGIKESCGKYYGAVGRALIQELLDQFDSREELEQEVSEWIDECHKKLVNDSLSDVQIRGARHFARFWVTGLFMRIINAVPFTEQEIEEAVMAVFNAWLEGMEMVGSVEHVTAKMASFISNNIHRFPKSESSRACSSPLGYQHLDYILITPEQFERRCGGLSPKEVARYMIEQGWLVTHEKGKHKCRFKFGDLPARQPFYAVNPEILSALGDETVADVPQCMEEGPAPAETVEEPPQPESAERATKKGSFRRIRRAPADPEKVQAQAETVAIDEPLPAESMLASESEAELASTSKKPHRTVKRRPKADASPLDAKSEAIQQMPEPLHHREVILKSGRLVRKVMKKNADESQCLELETHPVPFEEGSAESPQPVEVIADGAEVPHSEQKKPRRIVRRKTPVELE